MISHFDNCGMLPPVVVHLYLNCNVPPDCGNCPSSSKPVGTKQPALAGASASPGTPTTMQPPPITSMSSASTESHVALIVVTPSLTPKAFAASTEMTDASKLANCAPTC